MTYRMEMIWEKGINQSMQPILIRVILRERATKRDEHWRESCG